MPGLTSGLGDLVLNRLLYVPFGSSLRIAIWRPDRPAWRQVLQVMLIVASTSWLLECSQSLSSTRFASLSDFFANTLTGMLATIAAIRIRLATRATPGHGLLVLPRDRPMSWAEPRVQPAVLIGAVLLGVALVGSWDLLTHPTGLTAQVNWLPFADHFRRSHDMAALLLGRSLFVYGVVAFLLSLALFGNGRRRTLAYLFLWVSATGVEMELVDMVRVDQGPDITKPLLSPWPRVWS